MKRPNEKRPGMAHFKTGFKIMAPREDGYLLAINFESLTLIRIALIGALDLMPTYQCLQLQVKCIKFDEFKGKM